MLALRRYLWYRESTRLSRAEDRLIMEILKYNPATMLHRNFFQMFPKLILRIKVKNANL
jgi:hypothetical protein